MTVEIAVAPVGAAGDAEFVAAVAGLVNRVYAVAEEGLWRPGTVRTDAGEVAAVIAAGELAVARLGGRLAGAVRVQRLDGEVGEFGMLVTDPDHRGGGVGAALIGFAEGWARERGLSRMQLELLMPQTWKHPVKEFLHGWYTRIGYRRVRIGRLEDAYPALAPRLATPCDFAIYQKSL